MGLAASQARFLGITLRKANCEFKSTELAQQRLELTDQMTKISQDYANSLNSTKLVWSNGAVCDSFGNPMDYGLSYSLLMMPSAANDYNPYMVSTRSGAIVLSSKYADAAKAAGISMAGGTPSEIGRNLFIASLANGTIGADGKTTFNNDKHDNIITQTTYKTLISGTGDVAWHSSAGMGAVPKDKGVADIVTIEDLKAASSIGQVNIDWLQIVRGMLGLNVEDAMTEVQSERLLASYKENVAAAKLKYLNATYTDSDNKKNYIDSASLNALVSSITKYSEYKISGSGTEPKDFTADQKKKIDDLKSLDDKINNATASEKPSLIAKLENMKKGLDENGNPIGTTYENDGKIDKLGSEENKYLYPLYWSVYEQVKVSNSANKNVIAWQDTPYATANKDAIQVDISSLFQTSASSVGGGKYTTEKDDKTYEINQMTLVVNDVINSNTDEIKDLTIADLLSQNVSIITKGDNSIETISNAGKYIMEYLASVLGYGHIGTGLNVDTESEAALELALSMVEKKFLSAGAVVKNGGQTSDTSMMSNSAYNNANEFNRIGATSDSSYAALNLSNMLSAFLTYYDNFLRGTDSGYVVGKGNTDGKTTFVTDDPNYSYVTNTKEKLTNAEKIADFYNELYNNICAHGWRDDDMVLDSEYLESAVKDGRYQLMALNDDGYFYQERYNDVGYLEEVRDEDAIARAEVDFTTKKSEITYKENIIDVKSKKLDAEITELNTEINSVQNIISKSIEKTFSMFSN